MFVVGNRSFNNYSDAEKYCNMCDFDLDIIEKLTEDKTGSYNTDIIKEYQNKIKQFNFTVTKKSFHLSKLEELRQLYYQLMSVNQWLFNPDEELHFREYKRMIEFKETKKELDHKLKRCLMYLYNQLEEIKRIA